MGLALVLAALGLFGTLTAARMNYLANQQNNQSNQDIAQQTNQANIDLAGKENTWKLEQWVRENAYNTPMAQMQRLRQAGLNPSLMYGSGTGIMNEAAQSPDFSSAVGSLATPRMMPTDFSFLSSLGDTLNNSVQSAAQTALTRSEARLNNANAAVVEQTTEGKVENLTRQNELLQSKVDQTNAEIDVLHKRIDLMDSEQKLNLEKATTEQFNRGLLDKDYQLRYDEFQETLRMNKALTRKIEAEIGEIGTRIMRNKQDYLYYQEANAKLLLGLDYKNALINSEVKLNKINAALGGFEVASGLIDFKQDMANYRDFMGDNGDINRIGSSILNGLTWGLKRVSNSINVFKLSK